MDFTSLPDSLGHLLTYHREAPLIFSSGLFWVLFVCFMPVYALLRRRKWQMLVFVIAFSLYFYYKCSGWFFLLLVSTSVIDWFISRAMVEIGSSAGRKWLVALSVVISLSVLGFFKYANFFLWNWNAMVEGNFQPLTLILPVGISFYTFQSISYIVDVYRRKIAPAETWGEYLFFLSFFPALVAGPIVRAENFLPQLRENRRANHQEIYGGLWLILAGVIKKAVIADYIAQYNDLVFASPTGYSGFESLMGVIGYTMQIYCDFSGYSDMAIGLALIMGFRLDINFNLPYKSQSLTEFWRRWHISLGLWFKNYVFYPVQRTKLCDNIRKAMKKKKNRYGMNVFPTAISLTAVWTLIGLWHGFDWNYLCYDWFCGLIIISAELLKPVYDKVNRSAPKIFASGWMDMLRTLRTFLLVSFSFLFFRPDTMEVTIRMMRNLFAKPYVYQAAEFIYWHVYDLFLIAVPLLILGVVDGMKYKGIDVYERFHRFPAVVRYAVYVGGILLIYITKGDMSSGGFAYYVF